MTNEIDHPTADFTVLPFEESRWEVDGQKISELADTQLHINVGSPILGDIVNGQDHTSYDNLSSAFCDPATVAFTLQDNGQLVGFTFAIPIDRFNPTRQREAQETAYLYGTAITPDHQGKKLVKSLTDPLLRTLLKRGYKFVERDAVIPNGYADAISRAYGDSIIESYDHERFELGPQRFFRIDIEKYLENSDLQSEA